MIEPQSKTLPQLRTNFADPTDVINFLHIEQGKGKVCALIVVTGTDGGGVRAPGALAGVSKTGQCAGYISNGCVDADMFSQALEAIEDGRVRTVRYGAGSPYIDIRLPCGGAIDLMIIPNPEPSMIAKFQRQLGERQAIAFKCSERGALEPQDPKARMRGWHDDKFYVYCRPKLRLRIAGRGTEPIALMRTAYALDFDVLLQSPDEDRLEAARALGYEAQELRAIHKAPNCTDDAHTAFVMMFHDHDWEEALIKAALKCDAFYIGALGGRNTHKSRCNALRKAGVNVADIARIRGPIGLIPSVRNASYLAVSVLAEIISVYEDN